MVVGMNSMSGLGVMVHKHGIINHAHLIIHDYQLLIV